MSYRNNITNFVVRVKKFICREKYVLIGLRKPFWIRRRNRGRSPIRVYWANEQKNFGDMINGDVIKTIFGYNISWCPGEYCNMIGAGSIITFIDGSKNYVWGSGIIEDGDAINRDMLYCAVRGELTRNRLGERWQKIPLGDPGLLANIVYDKSKTKNNKIGIIPHYIDKKHEIVRRLSTDKRFVIIDVEKDPSDVARKISECSMIISSSLHGLIFADSFGIPNIHVQLSNMVTGGDYKFRDYYSATGRKYRRAEKNMIFDDEYLRQIKAEYTPVRKLRKIQRSIIKAFPY